MYHKSPSDFDANTGIEAVQQAFSPLVYLFGGIIPVLLPLFAFNLHRLQMACRIL
jgi:hypothetical protein